MRRLIAFILCLLPLLAHAEDAATRGQYIARLGDCTSCHTAADGQAFAGGLKLNTPLGTIYSTNISPDPETGIGNYSEADFARALREGIAKDGHHLYPAMPYNFFTQLTDADMHDLYVYFMQDVKPIHSIPPKTSLPFPLNQRWGVTFWNLIFSPDKRFTPDDSKDEAWNRGAYIVNGAGHCGACHTTRNIAYAPRGYEMNASHYLHGDTLEGWYAPSLRGEKGEGLGRLSEADIAQFLTNGTAPGTMAYGTMSQAVENSTRYLTPSDAKAVAHYLKSIPPSHDTAAYAPEAMEKLLSTPPTSAPTELPGAGFYASACASCHGTHGEGRGTRYPALAGNPAVLSANTDSVIHILLAGSTAPRTSDTHPSHMPAFAQYTDAQIADLASYLRSQWGNQAAPVTPRAVKQMRKVVNGEKNAPGIAVQ